MLETYRSYELISIMKIIYRYMTIYGENVFRKHTLASEK